MIRKMLAITIACLLIAASALAAVSVPEPDEDLFYVYDGADVLSLETEAQIYYNNINLFEACEAEIVFVVVDDTDGYSLEAYSSAIFDKWELYDRDVLVVLAIEDENYWMVQGSSIEREMTGSTMRALLDDYLEPDFAKADYDAGVRKLFDALFNEVTDIYNADIDLVDGYAKYSAAGNAIENTTGDNSVIRDDDRDEDSGISLGTILLIIIIVVIVVRVMRSPKQTRPSSGGGKTVIITPPPRIPRSIFTAPRSGRTPHFGGFTRPTGGNRTSSSRTGGFGGSSSRSSGFGGRSGGFGGRSGGGRSGGGGSRGGGIGRGR